MGVNIGFALLKEGSTQVTDTDVTFIYQFKPINQSTKATITDVECTIRAAQVMFFGGRNPTYGANLDKIGIEPNFFQFDELTPARGPVEYPEFKVIIPLDEGWPGFIRFEFDIKWKGSHTDARQVEVSRP